MFIVNFLFIVIPEPFYEFPVPDAYPENDDHFFSFFLTAIVLIVLLYVLYHNKNKVGKVVSFFTGLKYLLVIQPLR